MQQLLGLTLLLHRVYLGTGYAFNHTTPPGDYTTPPGNYTTSPGNYTTPPGNYTTTSDTVNPLNHTSTRANASREQELPDMSDEKRLCTDLMRKYERVGLNGRPVRNMSKSISVEFGLGLIQMDLDEKNKVLTTSMWSKYQWTDDYLQWDSRRYSGLRQVKLQSDAIWKPDIMLYNTADTDKAERKVLAVVGADGTVLWVPHQIFRSSCSIDVYNFPFDYQVCNMWFGSWTYSMTDINLTMAFHRGIDLSTFKSDYKESSAWEIMENSAERKEMPVDDPSYVVLAFTLKMRRKMVFSSYILTLPCVFLACLTLVVFWLPPDRPDRTALAMSTFGSFLVLLLILVEAAPPTASSVPTLGVYYCFNMVIIMTSIFLSTLVVNIDRCGDNRRTVPKWLMCLTSVFSRLLCISRKGTALDKQHRRAGSKDLVEEMHKLIPKRQDKVLGNGRIPSCIREHREAPAMTEQSGFKDTYFGTLHHEMVQMKTSLREMADMINIRIHLDRQTRGIAREWRAVATVLDRIFFLLYIIAITTSLVVLFPRPNH